MLMLGDILKSARHSAADFQRWVDVADPALAEDLRMAAERSGASLAQFARVAVADFSRFADEEAWAQLTRIVRDDEDPGMACLAAMVSWRLVATSCASHAV